jgi:hypothetical protein
MPDAENVTRLMEQWCDQEILFSWMQVGSNDLTDHSLFEWAFSRNVNGRLRYAQLPALNTTTSVSCFELILLALANADAQRYTRAHFKSLYESYLGLHNTEGQWAALLLQGPDFQLNRTATICSRRDRPLRGQLVFFNAGAHVCLATGETSQVGAIVSPELLSFWGPYPRLDPAHAVNHVMRSSVAEILAYLQETRALPGQPARTGPDEVTFGDPYWA